MSRSPAPPYFLQANAQCHRADAWIRVLVQQKGPARGIVRAFRRWARRARTEHCPTVRVRRASSYLTTPDRGVGSDSIFPNMFRVVSGLPSSLVGAEHAAA